MARGAGDCDRDWNPGPSQRDLARAAGGRIEERLDLAREGGSRSPVAEVVGASQLGPPVWAGPGAQTVAVTERAGRWPSSRGAVPRL